MQPIIFVILTLFAVMPVHAVFSPADIASLEMWLDASDVETISKTTEGRVTQWNDKSGKGKHATQGTDSQRPLFAENAVQGLSVVSLDGGDYMSSSCIPATGSNPRTLVATVANTVSMNVNYTHILHYGSDNTGQAYGICNRIGNVDVWGNHYWGSGFQTGVNSVKATPSLAVASYANGTDNFHINGNAPQRNTVSINTSTGYGLMLGSRVQPGEYGKFDALEIMAFSTALTQEERQLVEGYLAHKWGFASELPVDHPYKDVSPSEDGRGNVVTFDASGIASTAATFNGGLVSTGTSDTAVMVYWGEQNGGKDAAAWANTNVWSAPQIEGNLSYSATGLTQDSTYYYRFAATNASGLVWASSGAYFITGEVAIENTSNASEDGMTPGTFTVSRPGTTIGEALVVDYSKTGGTAASGVDHEALSGSGVDHEALSGSVTIPAGTTEATITVTPLYNGAADFDTTLELSITNVAAVIGASSSATMTILNQAVPSAPTNAWVRGGADALASTGANWSLGFAPTNSDAIVYLGPFASQPGMTWNITNSVAGWLQTGLYKGTVTIETKYPGRGDFTNMMISGDAVVEGGAWTHLANAGAEAYRLSVTVGGDFVLGSAATILVDNKGYTSARGPGAGTGWVDYSASATHGGVGGDSGGNVAKRDTQGSVDAPVNLGSASGGAGGGAVAIEVAGSARLDGIISANGQSVTYGCGSGGSIFMTAGSISGAGTLRSNGGTGGYSHGGGGRIALLLTGSESTFATWTGTEVAYGGGGGSGAGTVYRCAGSGEDWLIVDNKNMGMGLDNITIMPPGVNLSDYSHVIVRNKGVLGVRGDTILDFTTFNIEPVDAASSIVAVLDDGGVTYPADWVLEGYTLRGEGISKSLQNVTIRNGGVLSTTASKNDAVRKLTLDIAGNLVVESTGSIDLGGAGYADRNGPGAPTSQGGDGAAGATHGGIGGGSTSKPANNNSYGSVTAPDQPGSGSGQYGGGGRFNNG